MKITLVQPQFKNIWEPLWAGYLSSYLKQNYNGKLLFNFFHGNFNTDEEIINGSKDSDIVAFSCTTPTFQTGIKLAKKIKEVNKNVYIVFGGWHITSCREQLLEDDSFWNIVNCIIVGEGEKAFTNLIYDFYVYKNYHHVVLASHKTTFDQLPWPDRQLIRQDKTLKLCENMCGERIGSVQSIRGCKFRCKMCSEQCMTGELPLRVRDPEDTLDEIEYLVKDYNINRIKFVDPTWTISEKYVNEFCEEKIKRGIDIKFDAMLHASTATEGMIQIMAAANCDVFMVGVESGDQRILNDINKGVTLSKIEKVFEWGKKYCINRRAFFILGTPLEDGQSIENTRKLIYRISPDIVGFTILTPFPGNSYYRNEFKNVDWNKCDEYSNDFWYTSTLSNKQLQQIQKDLNKEFDHILVSHQRIIND